MRIILWVWDVNEKRSMEWCEVEVTFETGAIKKWRCHDVWRWACIHLDSFSYFINSQCCYLSEFPPVTYSLWFPFVWYLLCNHSRSHLPPMCDMRLSINLCRLFSVWNKHLIEDRKAEAGKFMRSRKAAR